jgi:uncharacterized protein with GYD domain
MAKYLALANYVGKGIEGLLKEGGTSRKEAAQKAAQSVGGNIDAFYYAFGKHDVVGIGDFPDAASAAAFSLMINASGAVSLTLTPLMTPEDIDAAAKKNLTYRAPGQ